MCRNNHSLFQTIFELKFAERFDLGFLKMEGKEYMHEIKRKRSSIESELKILSRQKKDMHHKLMQEQQRAAKSKNKGQKSIDQRKWPTVVSHAKAGKAEETSGHKKSAIDKRKSDLSESLSDLRLPEIIIPKFSIEGSEMGKGLVVQISNGSVGYINGKPLLSEISLSLACGERVAITGDNGSGKSTLIKAILGDESVYKAGDWHVVKSDNIGYVDQHYGTLNPDKSVLETIADLVPNWPHAEIRRHLNDFLFRKNEEVNAIVSTLSGGEKARLSLAQIAAKTPKLLILDEITNNLDLETKEHVIQVLKYYSGAMIVISHDPDFLEEIGVSEMIDVEIFRFSTG
ncbi:MAG: Vitamin B12 import ATP-binding protein BtuD [Holosporales bacterium]